MTGIQATTYARLRGALGLADEPVRIEEPFQLLAEVEEPVRRALGIDKGRAGVTIPVPQIHAYSPAISYPAHPTGDRGDTH